MNAKQHSSSEHTASITENSLMNDTIKNTLKLLDVN